MASKFQNRLVGSIILVSLGVIILPDVFDGKKQHYQEDVISIPLKPETHLDRFEIQTPLVSETQLPPSPVTLHEPTWNEVEVSTSSTDQVLVDVVQSQTLDTESNSAWIIQLMALKNADNAQTLVADLQKRGYQAHLIKEGQFTRVIIGPNVVKAQLERQLVELEKITGTRGQLLRFKPINP